MSIKSHITNLFVMILFFVLSSCEGVKYIYSYKLLDNHAKTDKSFDDGKISASFMVGEKQIDFSLKNLTSDPIKINWDESSLIILGESKRVMHKGVKYTDRGSSQVPTIIPSNSLIEDCVIPTDNISYAEGYFGSNYSVPPSWKIKDLLPVNDNFDADRKQYILNSKGQTIKLFLSIEINNQKTNYTFEFQITDVKPEEY